MFRYCVLSWKILKKYLLSCSIRETNSSESCIFIIWTACDVQHVISFKLYLPLYHTLSFFLRWERNSTLSFITSLCDTEVNSGVIVNDDCKCRILLCVISCLCTFLPPLPMMLKHLFCIGITQLFNQCYQRVATLVFIFVLTLKFVSIHF